MRSRLLTLVAMIALYSCSALAAQEPSKPEKEHEWLKQFVGEWETSAKSVAPGQPAMTCQGKTTSRMLGGLWLVSENNGKVMEAEIHALQTIGYDPAKKKYVGTWVDSMMNHLWKYEGAVDPTGKILTLEAEGPSFTGAGKSAKYRDSYEFKSKDHIVATSSMQGEDGKWVPFMVGNLWRKGTKPKE